MNGYGVAAKSMNDLNWIDEWKANFFYAHSACSPFTVHCFTVIYMITMFQVPAVHRSIFFFFFFFLFHIEHWTCLIIISVIIKSDKKQHNQLIAFLYVIITSFSLFSSSSVRMCDLSAIFRCRCIQQSQYQFVCEMAWKSL